MKVGLFYDIIPVLMKFNTLVVQTKEKVKLFNFYPQIQSYDFGF